MPEQPETSLFTSHYFTAEVAECQFSFRVLKMIDQTFIYIGDHNNETLDEVAISMPDRGAGVVGTTALGPLLGCESQELAAKLAKRLKRQVYVSCNVPADRSIRPLLEKRLAEEIKEHPEYFT